jgi:hypothetical protein
VVAALLAICQGIRDGIGGGMLCCQQVNGAVKAVKMYCWDRNRS